MTDSTHFTNLYLLAKKSNAYETYKDYDAWCETQLKAKIKAYILTEEVNTWGRNLYYTSIPKAQNKNSLCMILLNTMELSSYKIEP